MLGFDPSIHEQKANNSDYFQSAAQNDYLTKTLRKQTYSSFKEMKPDLQKLNDLFWGDKAPKGAKDELVTGLTCNMKSTFAYVRCVFTKCKFEHWFNYRAKGDLPSDIKYQRSINMNHSISAHKEGLKRDLKLFIK